MSRRPRVEYLQFPRRRGEVVAWLKGIFVGLCLGAGLTAAWPW